jgi:hypothetical protein
MKKLFLLATLCFSLSAFSQERRDSLPPITDSTKLFSISDVAEFDALLQKKFTISELATYRELFQWWQNRIRQRISQLPKPAPKK